MEEKRMNLNIKILEKVSLFSGMKAADIESVLECLESQERVYGRNQCIIQGGDEVPALGIVIKGRVQVIREDILGNRMLVAGLGPADIFAESLASAGAKSSPVSVYANEEATILWLYIKRLVCTCSASCHYHSLLIENLLQLLAKKNLYLNNRMELLSKRSIREKIIAFLLAEGKERNSSSFDIAMNRNEMAEYLCVDRSAMSRELSKLQEEGIIQYRKNHFKILVESQIMDYN
jgi:CRP-like cAMP-binding protein